MTELIAARDALKAAVENIGEMTSFRVGDPEVTAQFPPRDKEYRRDHNVLMTKVTFKEPKDPLKQASDFVKSVAAIKPPAGALWSFSIVAAGCSLSDAEKYREPLLNKAVESLSALRKVTASHIKVSVTGLEKPLTVARSSESEFMVSLPYSVTVESFSETKQQ
ncbi:MAG TPA: hypothetical protein VLT36_00975 [Candidatus Dormibacteraeota bacterium]|nr:hypothetical protein [Candidatus Dormibacteraeota bacterium]